MSQGKGHTNQDDIQVLAFYCSFYTVKGHLSDGIDRVCTSQNQTSNSFFLCTDTDS